MAIDVSITAARWRFRDKIYENYILLYNIHWPGLFFYHALDGSSFGRCYFGRGCREINIPFLLGSPGDDSIAVDVGFLPDYDFKRTPDEIDREAVIAAAAAVAEKARKEALDAEFLVSEGEQVKNAALLSGEEGLSTPAPSTAPPSDLESQDGASVDPDATTENTSGDVSATEPDSSDLESTG